MSSELNIVCQSVEGGLQYEGTFVNNLQASPAPLPQTLEFLLQIPNIIVSGTSMIES